MNIAARIGLLCLAALLFAAGASLTSWERARILERDLENTRIELENLRVDHRDTMDSITKALDAREVIHEQAKLHEESLREALANFPYADVSVSDDMRMCLQGNVICEIPAAGSAAQEHDDTGPLKNPDGR